MKALIVVDYQNDFLDNGPLPVKGSKELGYKIAECVDSFKEQKHKVIFSMDWHPLNHCSFKQWRHHCIKRTEGAKLAEPLTYDDADLIIKKGKKFYKEELSIFAKGRRSKIYKFLRDNTISELYICGLAKDICVLKTANDAYDLGFEVYLLENLSLSINEKDFEENINKNIKIIKWTNLYEQDN